MPTLARIKISWFFWWTKGTFKRKIRVLGGLEGLGGLGSRSILLKKSGSFFSLLYNHVTLFYIGLRSIGRFVFVSH
jgi:hypothetical protein